MKYHHRLGALLLFLVPVLGLLAGLGMSPAVGVDKITVVAPTHSLGQEVMGLLRVPEGASGLFYPLNHITQQVRRCPRVKEVTVDRTTPHEIVVRITAREPFAALDDGDGFTLISREGICLQRQAKSEALPVLLGMTVPCPPLGSQLQPEPYQWACEVLAGADKVSLKPRLRVDLRQPHHIIITTPEGLVGILGNVNNLARKMTIVGRVAEQVRAEGKVVSRVDVSRPESPIWSVQ